MAIEILWLTRKVPRDRVGFAIVGACTFSLGIVFLSPGHHSMPVDRTSGFDPDRAKSRILPENGRVRNGFARSASLRSLKIGQNSPKI
jgi:hypothetical protein